MRRLAAVFLAGLSSGRGIRSFGPGRRSASAAAKPNSGSLRAPFFFRPHAIRNTPPIPEHDPEKCEAVFRKDHAQPRIWSAMAIRPDPVALQPARTLTPQGLRAGYASG